MGKFTLFWIKTLYISLKWLKIQQTNREWNIYIYLQGISNAFLHSNFIMLLVQVKKLVICGLPSLEYCRGDLLAYKSQSYPVLFLNFGNNLRWHFDLVVPGASKNQFESTGHLVFKHFVLQKITLFSRYCSVGKNPIKSHNTNCYGNCHLKILDFFPLIHLKIESIIQFQYPSLKIGSIFS